MKCIIGLGNPGKLYQHTRHNVGFMVIDTLMAHFQVTPQAKFKSELVQVKINNETVLLVKPLTYMNLSGEAVALVMDYYHIDPKDILVIYDDLDIEVGKIRVREKGSAGGHNGMKSIIQYLHTQEFSRIRIGVGKNALIETKDYVLGQFMKAEQPIIQDVVNRVKQACFDYPLITFVNLMTKYNTQ